MKPETRTFAIGLLSFAAFLLSNLFPHLLPRLGDWMQSADPALAVIFILVMVICVQTVFLLHKRKH
ncbi:MAG TPA: hypothetical protein VFK44_02035 [Bacillales bacterium]|nr:hypothetical protein [Bacillales bacterium]